MTDLPEGPHGPLAVRDNVGETDVGTERVGGYFAAVSRSVTSRIAWLKLYGAFYDFAILSERTSGGEFWCFHLAATVVSIVLTNIGSHIWKIPVLNRFRSLVMFTPGIALTFRCFHDVSKSGRPF